MRRASSGPLTAPPSLSDRDPLHRMAGGHAGRSTGARQLEPSSKRTYPGQDFGQFAMSVMNASDFTCRPGHFRRSR
jgi:hypothetical protein